MRKGWIIALSILGALLSGTALWAQGGNENKPSTYTYVAEWAVPRAQWGEMAKVNEADRATMDKLIADGTITSYGEFESFIHTDGEPTHGSWFTASSEGNILKVLEQEYAQPDLTAPVLAASKHWDVFLEDQIHNGRSGKFDGAYLSVAAWYVKPGDMRAFLDLLKSRFVPLLDKLLADGTLVSYTVETRNYHTDKPGRVNVATVALSAAAVDKSDQAFEAAFKDDKEIGPAIGMLTSFEDHRDALLRVTHMVNK